MSQKTKVQDLLSAGADPEELIASIRQQAEENNRAKRHTIPVAPDMSAKDWAERKEWLLDGQPVFGLLKDYAWAGLAAVQADNQAEFTRQRDLLWKVVLTAVGHPSPAPTEPPSPPVA